MVNFAIGMDVGGTYTKIGLVDSTAYIIKYKTIASNLQTSDPTPFLASTGAIVQEFLRSCPVEGIGIALCSLVDDMHSGALLSVNAPALNGLDIRSAFESISGRPVQVMNDVNAYALAEYHLGAGRGVQRLLCLGLGTGLAIAVILNGRALETWGGVPADAGRIILDPGAQVCCKANVRGSAEALCGTAHIERLARQKYGIDLPAREVIAACRDGQEPVASEIMAEIGGHAGHLLALLSPVFFPQKIIITGGTAEAGETLFTAIRQRYAGLIGDYMKNLAALEGDEARPVAIVKGELGSEAAVIGATLGFLAPP